MLYENICVVEDTESGSFTTYESLCYDLIFGNENVIHITFDDFCEFDERLNFKEKIRTILNRGNVYILDDRIIHTKASIIWKLELKRL